MIISIGAEKVFDKIRQSFIIKTLDKLGTEGNFVNMIKSTYKKPTDNIFNSERLDTFHLRSQGRLLLPLLFNTVLEGLAREIRQKFKKKKNSRHLD